MTLAAQTIVLAHGGGGQLTDQLIETSIMPRLGNDVLGALLDAGIVASEGSRVALTIDSYVVDPWCFPGGDIGRLAVCGTVNDLAVCGAKPLGLALSLIIAEGFARRDLDTVLDSIRTAAEEANVRIISGDTKVIGAAAGDGIYVTTAGVGAVPDGRDLDPRRIRPDDVLILNGPIAEHGLTVMLAREMPEVQSILKTDAAPLNGLIEALWAACPNVKFMRDPTRSGLAGVGADLAKAAQRRIAIHEEAVPVLSAVRHAADMLGLDPLEVANEDKVVAVVAEADTAAALKAMRNHPLGRDAVAIGRVHAEADGLCELHTIIGGRRVIQKPYGEQLPRIC